MTEMLQQDGPAQRLAGESVAWLTTAGADGQPQSSPIWFIWDGASLWLRSQAQAGKVRNIKANPRVAFHLADDGYGGNIITIEGTASLRGRTTRAARGVPRQVRRSDPYRPADDAGATRRRLPDHHPHHAHPHQGLVIGGTPLG